MKSAASLRAIPAVGKVLEAIGDCGLPRPVLVHLVRTQLAMLRTRGREIPGWEDTLNRLRAAAQTLRLTRLQPVINGTGVLVHTNLGRAPLGQTVVRSLDEIAANYNNLEIDLQTGERGHRADYVDHCLALLCEAQAAAVVNNCAAALILILRHLARPPREEVIISRGELVQIGGGFRIPEILEASGARLREIGTTNQTTLSDYSRAIGRRTALILKVHRSNFFMGGFVEAPPTEAIAAVARKKRIPLIEDLGSGALISTETISGLEHEPTPAETVKHGVDLVCFSGDKLLGGPQAGIIAGKAKLVAALKREPFFRALRCDKLILAALQTACEAYLQMTANTDIPVLQMARTDVDSLRNRAQRIRAELESHRVAVKIGTSEARIGGGTLPRSSLSSVTLDFKPRDMPVEQFARRLRAGQPPVIGYIADHHLRIDLRTVFPSQDALLVQALRAALD